MVTKRDNRRPTDRVNIEQSASGRWAGRVLQFGKKVKFDENVKFEKRVKFAKLRKMSNHKCSLHLPHLLPFFAFGITFLLDQKEILGNRLDFRTLTVVIWALSWKPQGENFSCNS